MKTLNTFLEQTGYLKVKSPDEQKFVDKHEVVTKADRAGNKDDVFKATNVKPIDRKKERKGYNPGEDEAVYEALKGDQHKIDANKNGKLDAHDFMLLRKKKKMKEEAEQIDELSTDTLQSYRKKARAQGNAIVDKMKMGGGDWSKDQKDTKTLRKRAAGAQASGKQLVKRGESLKTEEAELVEGMTSADRYAATHASAKALVKSINDHLNAHKDAATKHKNSFSAKKGPTWGHVGDIEHLHGQLKDIHDRLASQGEYANTMREETELDEKTLTPAELKKREQVAKAMERENPGMNKSKKMAIATATAKKVAEETLTGLIADLSEANQATLLSVFDKLSEENQAKFVEACETPEGVEAMLDFAIQNRGK